MHLFTMFGYSFPYVLNAQGCGNIRHLAYSIIASALALVAEFVH